MKKIINFYAVFGMISLGMGFIANIVKKKIFKYGKKNNYVHFSCGIYEKYFKYPLDFALSMIAIVTLAPVLLITAGLVRLKLGPPIIFSQDRPGLYEEIFKLYKFRTMTDKKDQEGNLLPDEERITVFGKWLRRSSLDELPELFNIIRGDMSIVGPRPLLVEYLPYYSTKERKRHDVRPGLTGISQINGRNNLEWNKRLELDVKYVEHITFVGDLKIILLTIIKVLKKSDIAVGNELKIENLDVERQHIQ